MNSLVLFAAGNPVAEIAHQFGVTWQLLISQIILFVIVALALKKFAYGPILEMLEQRRTRIAESLANADKIKSTGDVAKNLASLVLAKKYIANPSMLGGKAVKGPTAKMMQELGLAVTSATVAGCQRGLRSLSISNARMPSARSCRAAHASEAVSSARNTSALLYVHRKLRTMSRAINSPNSVRR